MAKAVKPKSQTGHDVVTTTAVQLIGVAVFTALAGVSDDMGSVMVVLMWGIFLGWLLLHTTELGNMVKALLWALNSGKCSLCFSSARSS